MRFAARSVFTNLRISFIRRLLAAPRVSIPGIQLARDGRMTFISAPFSKTTHKSDEAIQMKKSNPAKPAQKIPKLNRNFTIHAHPDDTADSLGDRLANALLDPVTSAQRVISSCEGLSGIGESIHLESYGRKLRADAEAIKAGDLSLVEEMLISQATSLQALFVRMIERAMGAEYIPSLDLYMKYALRAQNQARHTLETLGAIKNPPVIARQANIATNQMINNGPPTRAENISCRNELLEVTDGKRLDNRAQGAAGRANPTLEAMGAVNGTQERPR
jgi:hypothetical protein